MLLLEAIHSRKPMLRFVDEIALCRLETITNHYTNMTKRLNVVPHIKAHLKEISEGINLCTYELIPVSIISIRSTW